MKAIKVIFKDRKYNYVTSFNNKISDKEAIMYFKGKMFNLGIVKDDLHLCIDAKICK